MPRNRRGAKKGGRAEAAGRVRMAEKHWRALGVPGSAGTPGARAFLLCPRQSRFAKKSGTCRTSREFT